MTRRHISLYDSDKNPAPDEVLKQELITIEKSDSGIRITRFKRRFECHEMLDSFESEPILIISDKFIQPSLPEEKILIGGDANE